MSKKNRTWYTVYEREFIDGLGYGIFTRTKLDRYRLLLNLWKVYEHRRWGPGMNRKAIMSYLEKAINKERKRVKQHLFEEEET